MPVQTYLAELMGTFPRLSYLHALQLVNRAWARVRDIRLWSWQLIVDAELVAPQIITTGTASVTQYATSITVNTAAAVAINASDNAFIPVASPTRGIGRQIRINAGTGILPNNSNIYSITAWDGVNTLTIDKPFVEGTLTLAPYQLYKLYYAPPNYPFLSGTADANLIRPVSLTNRRSGYTITGRRLFYSQEQLNRFDPVRSATDGDARVIAPYQSNSLGQPVWELYPAPTNAAPYAVTYYSRWPDLSAAQDFPQVPYGLAVCVLDLARYFACQWALANVATFKELQMTNWVAAGASYKQEFMEGLRMILKQDDEIMPQLPSFQGRRQWDFPIGGTYLQNHDITSAMLLT